MKVTVAQLKALNACKDQLALFEQTFGEETEVTEAACKQAAHAGLDVDWATENLLTETQCEAYKQARAPLRAAYEQARAPLRAAYEQARAPLRAAYEQAKVPLRAAYEQARVPLWEAYEQARAPLWEAYDQAHAPLWETYEQARAPLWEAYKQACWQAFFNAAKPD